MRRIIHKPIDLEKLRVEAQLLERALELKRAEEAAKKKRDKLKRFKRAWMKKRDEERNLRGQIARARGMPERDVGDGVVEPAYVAAEGQVR